MRVRKNNSSLRESSSNFDFEPSDSFLNESFNSSVEKDLPVVLIKKSVREWRGLLGRVLSNEGGHRRVFEHKFDPSLVVKKARRKVHYISNLFEFETWSLAKANGCFDLLAECVEISHSGRYLIQVKGEHVSQEDIPVLDSLPRWLNWDVDVARQWVRVRGKVVVCDYAHNQLRDLKAELAERDVSSNSSNTSFRF